MGAPPPNLTRLLGYGTAIMAGAYFIAVISLHRPEWAPYPRWTSLLGACLVSYLPIKYADDGYWSVFLLSLLGFGGSLALVLTIVL